MQMFSGMARKRRGGTRKQNEKNEKMREDTEALLRGGRKRGGGVAKKNTVDTVAKSGSITTSKGRMGRITSSMLKKPGFLSGQCQGGRPTSLLGHSTLRATPTFPQLFPKAQPPGVRHPTVYRSPAPTKLCPDIGQSPNTLYAAFSHTAPQASTAKDTWTNRFHSQILERIESATHHELLSTPARYIQQPPGLPPSSFFFAGDEEEGLDEGESGYHSFIAPVQDSWQEKLRGAVNERIEMEASEWIQGGGHAGRSQEEEPVLESLWFEPEVEEENPFARTRTMDLENRSALEEAFATMARMEEDVSGRAMDYQEIDEDFEQGFWGRRIGP
ncbi:hypothetical protein YB2330_005982 [Saitoella coloradoensis]